MDGSPKWTLEALKEHYDERLTRDESEMIRRFDGFPQEYVTKADYQALEVSLDTIRADHVQRSEFDEIKRRVNEASGGRQVYYALIAVVVTVIVVAIGYASQNSVTHAEVSGQIQREAPWMHDRPAIMARLQRLENQVTVLQAQISEIQQLDRFFCRTRAPKLPTC